MKVNASKINAYASKIPKDLGIFSNNPKDFSAISKEYGNKPKENDVFLKKLHQYS